MIVQAQRNIYIVSDSFAGDANIYLIKEIKQCIELTKWNLMAGEVDLVLSKWNGMV